MLRSTRLLITLTALSALTSIAQAGLYRWVDSEGNVHYTDTIPPSQITEGHTEISEGGVRLKTVPPAKTVEEIEKERELERLRLQQERLIEQQKAADRVLLQTFRSEDDIVMARNGKIQDIDVMISVTKNNIRRQQEWLARLRSEAANLERTGQSVPKHLGDGIANTGRSIRDAYGTIVERENQKKAIGESFDQDLDRFRQLKKLTGPKPAEQAQGVRPLLHNIVPCGRAGECDRLWQKATAYVRKHATTKVQTDGPNILITAPPASENDISLILSRIDDKEGDGESLFLDLQCQSHRRGARTCQSREAKYIIEGFRPALTGEDAPNP